MHERISHLQGQLQLYLFSFSSLFLPPPFSLPFSLKLLLQFFLLYFTNLYFIRVYILSFLPFILLRIQVIICYFICRYPILFPYSFCGQDAFLLLLSLSLDPLFFSYSFLEFYSLSFLLLFLFCRQLFPHCSLIPSLLFIHSFFFSNCFNLFIIHMLFFLLFEFSFSFRFRSVILFLLLFCHPHFTSLFVLVFFLTSTCTHSPTLKIHFFILPLIMMIIIFLY